MNTFKIPDAVAVDVTLEECSNCHSPTPVSDLAAGLCRDCQAATVRVAALSRPKEVFVEAITLPVEEALPPDELEARRARRKAVKDAAEVSPQGWLQHAIEAVRSECVRSRTGHEFTTDTIVEEIERQHFPLPPDGETSLRFVMQHATQRGWCVQTDRKQPSRRPELRGREIRVYRSCL